MANKAWRIENGCIAWPLRGYLPPIKAEYYKIKPMEIEHMVDFDKLLKHYDCFGVGAEVGVAEGRTSLMFMRMGIPKLFLIDVWATHPEIKGDASSHQDWHDNNLADCQLRLKDYDDKVVYLQGLSTEMAKEIKDGELDWVYLDAAHDFYSVLEDLVTYYPKVKEGGIMAGHDFLAAQYGVNDAVTRFCAELNIEVHTIPEISTENASFWFQKPKTNVNPTSRNNREI